MNLIIYLSPIFDLNYIPSYDTTNEKPIITLEFAKLIAQRLDKICQIIPYDRQNDCYHSIGHPIYHQFKHLRTGEFICQQLPNDWQYYKCIGGLYMLFSGSFQKSVPFKSENTDQDSAINFCRYSSEPIGCFYYIKIDQEKSGDYLQVLDHCIAIEDDYLRQGCLQRFSIIYNWWTEDYPLPPSLPLSILKPILDGAHYLWLNKLPVHVGYDSLSDSYCGTLQKFNVEEEAIEYCSSLAYIRKDPVKEVKGCIKNWHK